MHTESIICVLIMIAFIDVFSNCLSNFLRSREQQEGAAEQGGRGL